MLHRFYSSPERTKHWPSLYLHFVKAIVVLQHKCKIVMTSTAVYKMVALTSVAPKEVLLW